MGRDKAQLVLDGDTLLDRAVRRLGEIADPVIVAAGTAPIAGYRCVLDTRPGAGPLAGVHAALAASPHPLLAVVAVDMPSFDTGLLLELAQRHDGADVVVPRSRRGLEPLHAVYAQRALPKLRRALDSDVFAMRSVLAELDVVVVDAATVAPGFSDNLNDPSDVMAWEAAHRRHAKPPR